MARNRNSAKQSGERRVILVPASEVKTCKPEGINTNPLTFQVEGIPAPQGSKRYVGHGRMIESSKKLKPWRDKLIQELSASYTDQPLDEPIQVTAAFFMPKPKRPRFPEPAVTPDADKLARAVGDALTHAGVIKDDARITQWHITKQYHPQGWTGAHITITWKETQ
nr:MAG TPA: Endodeoxyribonuclease RusA [Caudoviricetes sp.]